jgi:hypothetical protein
LTLTDTSTLRPQFYSTIDEGSRPEQATHTFALRDAEDVSNLCLFPKASAARSPMLRWWCYLLLSSAAVQMPWMKLDLLFVAKRVGFLSDENRLTWFCRERRSVRRVA